MNELAPALDIRGLSKTFGRRNVVDHLDIAVPTGAIAGFIGPNGAGKTTTLRMLLGLVQPSSGTGSVLGQPFSAPASYLDRVGALIESPAFYPALSGRTNLRAFATLGGHPVERVMVALERVGLADRGDDAYRTYSLGMKQRLGIAAALLPDPALLVLDEPTNGLDPAGIRDMRRLLRSLSAGGLTVLVSSHLLAELEQVCDWLIVLDHGKGAYLGPAQDFMATDRCLSIRPEHDSDLPELTKLLRTQRIPFTVNDQRLRLSFDPEPSAIASLVRSAADRGITLVEITTGTASLEDRYSELVDQGGLR